MAQGRIVGKLDLNTKPWHAKLAGATKGVRKFGSSSAAQFSDLAKKAALFGGGLLAIRGAAGVVSKSIGLAAAAEQTEAAFTTMLGSASKARGVMDELNKFAATTPFQLPEIQAGARQLLAFGVTTGELGGKLQMLGDLAAGTGSSIGELVRPFGAIKAKGRAELDKLLQFAERGVPIFDALGETMGVSKDEVFKLVSAGKVGFSDVEKALESLTTNGGKFEGMMARQSETLSGVWSTFKDNVDAALREVGASLVETFDIKTAIKNATAWVVGFVDKLKTGAKVMRVLKDNMDLVWRLAIESAKLQLVRFGNTLYHYLGTVPLELLKWFGRNWQEVFKDLYNIAATAMENIGKNIADNFDRIVEQFKNPLQGISAADFKWKPLLDGFESGLKELPKIPARQAGPLERELSKNVENLAGKLGDKISAELEKDLRKPLEVTEEAKATPATGPAASGINQRARSIATQYAGGAAQGTSAAYSAILRASRNDEHMRLMRRQLEEEKRQRELLEIMAAKEAAAVAVVDEF